MPCVEWFEEQDSAYREQVLPHRIKARVSVEAGVTFGWRTYVGDSGASIGVDHFGASADYRGSTKSSAHRGAGGHRGPDDPRPDRRRARLKDAARNGKTEGNRGHDLFGTRQPG